MPAVQLSDLQSYVKDHDFYLVKSPADRKKEKAPSLRVYKPQGELSSTLDVSSRVSLVSKMRKFNDGCEDVDRLLRLGESACTVLHAHNELSRQPKSEPLDKAMGHLSLARDMLGFVRIVPATVRVLNIFKKDNGETRSPIGVALDIIILVARWLSPIKWLHKIGAINIGRHAANIGTTIVCCWSAVVSLCFVSSLLDYAKATDPSQISQAFTDLIYSFSDLLALPWDIGFLFNNPISMLIGGILMGLSSIVHLAIQLMDHKVIVPIEEGNRTVIRA